MTKEELIALLADTDVLDALAGSLNQSIVASVSELLPSAVAGLTEGLDQRITTAIAKAQPDASTSASSESNSVEPDNALSKRLKLLEKQVADAEKARLKAEAEAAKADRDTRFDREYQTAFDTVTAGSVQHRDYIFNTLRKDLADFEERDGKFLSSKGKTVQETVSEFFASDVGKHFLTPSVPQYQNAYSQSRQTIAKPAANSSLSPEEALAQSFLAI